MNQIWAGAKQAIQGLLIAVLMMTALGIGAPLQLGAAAEETPGAFDLSGMPLAFIANAGQADPEVVFHAVSLGGSLFFTPTQAVLALPVGDDASFVLRQEFLGAQTAQVSGYNPVESTFNFFISDDPAAWRTGVDAYGGVLYNALYPGIDLRYEGTQGVLKSTYAVAAGADPSLIRWQYRGAARTSVDAATGDLRITLWDDANTGPVTLVERAPVAWQTIGGRHVPVTARFDVDHAGHVGFALGAYDPAHALVVDPSLQYSTYLGGYLDDRAYSVVTDNAGNVYVVGRSTSSNFPRSQDAYQYNLRGSSDAFIAKLNVSISSQKLLYGTFLGGTGDEYGMDIAVGPNGNLLLTGETTSVNFPTTASAFQTINAGGADAFVTKLSADGAALLFSTYLGGGGADRGVAIAVDGAGSPYVAGYTESNVFPTLNPVQEFYAGGRDAFATKLTADASALVYSTYQGGLGADEATGIDIDDAGQAVIVGFTNAGDFPTAAPYQAASGGGQDGFVVRLSSTGSAYVYSTYFGGAGADQMMGVVQNRADGTTYITGWTMSSDFPVTLNALQATSGGAEDAFITVLNNAGDTLSYSTYLGGSSTDKAADITRDPQGIVHVAGETLSADYPIYDPFPGQGTHSAGIDAFVTALDLNSNSYFYSTFIGGNADDKALAVAVDVSGGIYVAGETASTDFPLVNAAFQRGGAVDAFIVKVGSTQSDLQVTKTSDVAEVLVGDPVTFYVDVTNLGPNDTTSVQIEDILPAGIVVDSLNTTQGTCNQAGTLIMCDLGTIVVDQTVTITVVATVVQKGTLTNTAEITQSSEFDPVTPNVATVSVTAFKLADLEVEKSASTYRVRPTETITFTVEVENAGPSATSGVTLTDPVPPGLTYVSHSATQGTYNPVSGLWDIGELAKDAVATLTVTTTVSSNPIGTVIVNSAAGLTNGETDPDTTNDSDSVELVVVSQYFPPYACHPSETDPNVIICIAGNE